MAEADSRQKGWSDLVLAEIDGEGEVHGAKHGRRRLLQLRVDDHLAQTLVHHRIKEGEVMPANLASEQELEHMATQVERTDLILEQAESDESVNSTQNNN